jgi:biopolymer transport protein ExbB
MTTIDLTLFQMGGPLMWVLFTLSVVGSVLFVERLLYLHKGQVRTHQFLTGIENLLVKRRRLEALTLCEGMPGPVPSIIKSILLQADGPQAEMENAAKEAALVEVPILERRLGSIAAIAKIGPMVGLLGTVLGVIEAFTGMGTAGGATGYPSFGLFLVGLGQALLTTAFGLVISILASAGHYFLNSRVKALVHDMEFAAHSLTSFILSRRLEAEAGEGSISEELD